MPSIAPIPVVCAVIFDADGRALLAQRPAHKHLGGKWEFPGGKIEPGEAPEVALIREIREELGCDIFIRRAAAPVSAADLAATFAHAKKEAIAEILSALVVLGRAHKGEKRGPFTA